MIIEYANKLIEETNVNSILRDKEIIMAFPFKFLDSSKNIDGKKLANLL